MVKVAKATIMSDTKEGKLRIGHILKSARHASNNFTKKYWVKIANGNISSSFTLLPRQCHINIFDLHKIVAI